jgi:hypothetical protein
MQQPASITYSLAQDFSVDSGLDLEDLLLLALVLEMEDLDWDLMLVAVTILLLLP